MLLSSLIYAKITVFWYINERAFEHTQIIYVPINQCIPKSQTTHGHILAQPLMFYKKSL
jgi:hypothetical protein